MRFIRKIVIPIRETPTVRNARKSTKVTTVRPSPHPPFLRRSISFRLHLGLISKFLGRLNSTEKHSMSLLQAPVFPPLSRTPPPFFQLSLTVQLAGQPSLGLIDSSACNLLEDWGRGGGWHCETLIIPLHS